MYVQKKKGTESNPYLVNPDIKTVDGRILPLRNPAFMTREISEYAEKEGIFKFHITSLKLMNSHNEPDEFEKKSLLASVREESIGNVTVTLSLGVVCVQEGDRSVDDIIRRMDENLSKAKKSGRDRISS